jgi:hypothetical protein
LTAGKRDDADLKTFFLIMFVQGESPHIPFPPDLILYVNLGAKGAPEFIKPLAPTAWASLTSLMHIVAT